MYYRYNVYKMVFLCRCFINKFCDCSPFFGLNTEQCLSKHLLDIINAPNKH